MNQNAPDPNSRLTGASFNGTTDWNSQGSQWVYFSHEVYLAFTCQENVFNNV